MKPLDMCMGKLDWVLGRGWISRFEASRLAPGTAVRSRGIAGKNYLLQYNGEHTAETGAVPFEENDGTRLCAVIRSLARSSGPEPDPYRGDEMTELLPFSILIGTREASLEDLSGLGSGSLIDFHTDPDAPENCTLIIAGHPCARGKACVIGENFGIRIVSILSLPSPDAPYRTTGNCIDPSSDNDTIKDYDFHRPDFFTKRQLDSLYDIHIDFLRSFSSRGLQGNSKPSVTLVDQLNFREFLDSLETGACIIPAPTGASGKPRQEAPALPEKLILSSGDDFPVKTAEAWIRSQAESSNNRKDIVFTAGSVPETLQAKLFEALRDAWKSRGALTPYPAGPIVIPDKGAYEPFCAWMDEYEMIAIVTMDLGSEGNLSFVYPGRMLEKILPAT